MNLEEKYILTVPVLHRKKYGQFYTSDKIAEFMINWITKGKPKNIFDPAFGMGIFYTAAKKAGFQGKFFASEIDKISFEFYNNWVENCEDFYLKNEDYFLNWDKKWDAIICNPPYLKFQNFPNKTKVLEKLNQIFNVKMSGYTNMASAFLLKSIFELNEGGRLAYIMPHEFLNTGYGKIIKEVLLTQGSIKKIIQVSDEAGVFNSVTTTVCIILFEKKHASNTISFEIIEDAININVKNIKKVSVKNIQSKDKWLSFFDESKNFFDIPQGFIPLKTYGKFKRGIATGANDFFSLTHEQVIRLGLEESEVQLCITKSSQVKSSFFHSENLNDLIKNNSSIYVFNPKNKLDSSLSKAALQYIEYGESKGYNNRYLTKNRTPWYFLEKRIAAPILFGVFSRGGYKIIRNKTDVVSLTCFHGFEPNLLGSNYLDKIFIFLKSYLGNQALFRNKRKYGGNLDKFEPSDLNNILIPSPEQFDLICNEEVLKEMNFIQKTDKISSHMEHYLGNLFKE